MEHPDPFWEERLVRPQDIYPEYRKQGADYSTSLGSGRYAMRSVFLVDTPPTTAWWGCPALAPGSRLSL